MDGSGTYAENLARPATAGAPKLPGVIQHDMILYDHGMPPGPKQRSRANINIEYQAHSRMAGESAKLAAVLLRANRSYARDYPATIGSNMAGTDSIQFEDIVPSVSLREKERIAGIVRGSNPNHHERTGNYSNYSEEDFRFGFNSVETTLGALGQLAGISLAPPRQASNTGFSGLKGSLMYWRLKMPGSLKLIGSLSGFVLLLAAAPGAPSPAAPGTYAESYSPPNETDVPNPYKTIKNWAQLPDGRKWGATADAGIGPDGNIWTYDRCGANNCEKSDLDPILEFDQKTGRNLAHFGKGLFVQPHGLYVDRHGNVWVTDDQAAKDKSKGLQVFEFSPDGRILMTLGKKGQSGMGPDIFGAPTDVVIAPNGDIFVTDGHPGCGCENSRVVRFDKNGKYLMEFGKKGKGTGELDNPHTIDMDSRGHLFVGDRSNNRVVIFDRKGKFLGEWKQFGRPTGLFIAPGDVLYVTDTESQSDTPGDPGDLNHGFGYNPGVHRGIRIGLIRDGKVTAFIPDPSPKGRTSFSDGVAADREGNVYGAEVGPRDFIKYSRN